MVYQVVRGGEFKGIYEDDKNIEEKVKNTNFDVVEFETQKDAQEYMESGLFVQEVKQKKQVYDFFDKSLKLRDVPVTHFFENKTYRKCLQDYGYKININCKQNFEKLLGKDYEIVEIYANSYTTKIEKENMVSIGIYFKNKTSGNKFGGNINSQVPGNQNYKRADIYNIYCILKSLVSNKNINTEKYLFVIHTQSKYVLENIEKLKEYKNNEWCSEDENMDILKHIYTFIIKLNIKIKLSKSCFEIKQAKNIAKQIFEN